MQRLKNNLHIEKKCIIIIGTKGWEGWKQSSTCWTPKWGKILWTLHKLCNPPQAPVTWSLLWELSLSPVSFFSWREATIQWSQLISFNNKRFKEFISDIYPKELTISETTESTSVASYLDLHFIRDNSNNITTKLDDKHDSYVWLLHCELSFHVKQYSISTSLWCLCISAHSLCPLLLKL